MSYGSHLSDAKVMVGTHSFDIWVHPTDRTLLINRSTSAAAGEGFVNGLTFGVANHGLPEPEWRAAADALLSTMGSSCD